MAAFFIQFLGDMFGRLNEIQEMNKCVCVCVCVYGSVWYWSSVEKTKAGCATVEGVEGGKFLSGHVPDEI